MVLPTFKFKKLKKLRENSMQKTNYFACNWKRKREVRPPIA